MKIYTRKGDDGTTGLLYGGRVRKDSPLPVAYGSVDEAQAALGVARAQCERGSELDDILVGLERDLWVLMAELATDPKNRHKLTRGQSLVTEEMVSALERRIDELDARFEPPTEFVVPGQNRVAAQLDVARTVVRRAERAVLAAAAATGEPVSDSHAVAYLNRLSDLCWTMARWQETEGATGGSLTARSDDS
jgi:cob(I)alamin adenosyltransferase